MVGSSSSSTSGRANSTAASATRIRQPPENSAQARACAAASKPSPCRIAAARASAECASMSASRCWISAMRCASSAILRLGQQRGALGVGGEHGVDQAVAGRRRLLRHPADARAPAAPRSRRRRAPARRGSAGTAWSCRCRCARRSPTLCPAGIVAEASSKSRLPSSVKLMFLIASIRADVARAGRLVNDATGRHPVRLLHHTSRASCILRWKEYQ